VARDAGVIPTGTVQLFMLVIGLSMAATPLLLTAARALSRRLERTPPDNLLPDLTQLKDHIVIAGFGRVGQTMGLLLESVYVPYIALDLDSDRVADARRRGVPVFFGDASRGEVLKAAAVERARAVVVTMDDPDSAGRTVQVLRQLLPDLPILARARDLTQCARLTTAGATRVVPEIVEGSLQLGGALLTSLGETPSAVNQILDQFRRETYSRLADARQPLPGSKVRTASGRVPSGERL
jgi:CPA2 family monovalent cation:H+ antiporter-2